MIGALLAYLKPRAGRWAHPLAVARALRTSPRALHAGLAELKKLGFPIDQEPYHGIMLHEGPWPMTAQEIREKLATHIIGREVHCLSQTTSTNDVARRLDARSAPEGTLVFADYQTQGRGRFNRRWVAEPFQALLMSVLLRPEPRPALSSLMTIMGAVAVVRCLAEHYGLLARIRWPNDVLIGDGKVAGVLVEKSQNSAYVVGIGVNVGRPPDAPGATSIAAHLERQADRAELAVRLALELDCQYMAILSGAGGELEKQWREYSCTIGKPVRLAVGRKTFRGVVEDLTASGIIVRFKSGYRRRFRAEHVNRLEVEAPAT